MFLFSFLLTFLYEDAISPLKIVILPGDLASESPLRSFIDINTVLYQL